MACFLFLIVSISACIVLSNCLIPNNDLFYSDINDTVEGLYRIKNVKPISYKLYFKPFLNNFTFSGSTSILFELLENTTVITLNAVDLTIEKDSVVLKSSNNERINITSIITDKFYQRLLINSNSLLQEGLYSLDLDYTGLIRNNSELVGFYYGTHYINGNITYYGGTQFEAMSARKAFPCFDEPGLRAQFSVHISRYPYEMTVSNMPLLTTNSSVDADGRVWDIYQDSPKMASYLVAFFVGQFANITSKDEFYTLYARPDAIDQGSYALSLMGTIISTLTDFLEVSYTLPKLDLVVMPDFSAGAMENWGMTTIRESYGLFKEGTSSEYYKDYILQLLSHEFGHQWFGDLVTTEWWGNIWLNEGFATYWQHTISALIQPTWKFEEAFSLRAFQVALESDVDDTHAITYTAYSSSDTKFDDISYRKAGSVLKMVEHTITLDVFKKGLNSYLTTTVASGGVALPSLLFEAIEEKVQNSSRIDFKGNFNFTTFLKSWTLVPGFPLITVKVSDRSAIITQERFSLNSIKYNTSWYVPLTYTSAAENDFKTLTPKAWITPGDVSVDLSIPADSGWMIFNILQSGFYRVNYDENNWKLLIEQLKENLTKIPAVNRGQLIDDAFHLAEANYLNYSIVFSLVEYLKNETDYIPWQAAMKNFKKLIFYFQGTELCTELKTYVSYLYSTYFNSVAHVTTNDHMTLLGRIDALQFACDLEYAPCVDYTSSLFKMWSSSEIYFPAEEKTAAICTGLKEDASEIGYIFEKYNESNVFSDKVELLKAMACIRDHDILQFIMELFFLTEGNKVIKQQHKEEFFNKVIDKPDNIDFVISFVKNNFERMVSTSTLSSTKSLISSLGKKLILESHIQSIEAFVNNESLPQELRDSFNASLPQAKKRQLWIQTYSTTVSSALTPYYTKIFDTPSKGSAIPQFNFINIAVVSMLVYKYL